MYTAAVVTLSDKGSIGEREDLSGKKIIEVLEQYEYKVEDYTILPDDVPPIYSISIFFSSNTRITLSVTDIAVCKL